ncbi:MAG: hypothetical protein AAFR22_19405, partial [Chloroflexota bacterium]
MTHHSLAITGLHLVNATTNTTLRQIDNGDVLVLDHLPNNFRFNLTAAASGTPGSVFLAGGWFGSGIQYWVRTENVSPFAWFGDWAGNFNGEPLRVGCYDIVTVPHRKPHGEGRAGAWARFRFKVIQSSGDPLPPDPEVGRMTGFKLINADTGAVVKQLQNAETLYLDSGTLPANFNVEAMVEDAVGRVRYEGTYDDDSTIHTISRTERISPFTWFGDLVQNNQGYFNRGLTVGRYRFTATPYLLVEATEEQGQPVDFEFSVADSPPVVNPESEKFPIIDRFLLIDAATDNDVLDLDDGVQLIPGTVQLPADLRFNVRVAVNADVQSVKFEGEVRFGSSATTRNRVKSAAPFTWFGD